MEFMNERDVEAIVEIHVKLTREELESLVYDMENGFVISNPYTVTHDFFNYLQRL